MVESFPTFPKTTFELEELQVRVMAPVPKPGISLDLTRIACYRQPSSFPKSLAKCKPTCPVSVFTSVVHFQKFALGGAPHERAGTSGLTKHEIVATEKDRRFWAKTFRLDSYCFVSSAGATSGQSFIQPCRCSTRVGCAERYCTNFMEIWCRHDIHHIGGFFSFFVPGGRSSSSIPRLRDRRQQN